MELKEGKMTIRELSLWFGLKPDTISNGSKSAREKKFNLLKTYADYHMEGTKIVIDRVKYPVYSKAFEIIEEEFPKRWGHIKNSSHEIIKDLKKNKIDTCTRVSKDIWYNVPSVQQSISLETSRKYVNKVKTRDYGRNYLDEHGLKGRSEYVWMNKDGTAPLDAESLEIVKQCSGEAYGEVSLLIAAIEEDYRKGCLTLAEKQNALGAISVEQGYDRFVELVIEKLGFYPEKRTRLIDEISFD